ncbi:hypothetical protein F6X40_35525 [Paraburkholderia sp. UCT31]|uniref:hypothetical protein n=1 Tax=Paraburkholderia sp. UCT31 TaxID=2615209 RepID=UPI001655EA55|nr:hypothetical protein [Paraburkholderia sp. UCT31]MBC8741861.1 hypothetical protein [Paraburkholderia sp. UCT31]
MEQLVMMKEDVCLLTRDELDARRVLSNFDDETARLVAGEPIYRQVSIDTNGDVIHVHLKTVDETAVTQGVWSEGRDPADYTILLEDVRDVDGIRWRLREEKVAVSAVVLRMLERLKDNMRMFRTVLAA